MPSPLKDHSVGMNEHTKKTLEIIKQCFDSPEVPFWLWISTYKPSDIFEPSFDQIGKSFQTWFEPTFKDDPVIAQRGIKLKNVQWTNIIHVLMDEEYQRMGV